MSHLIQFFDKSGLRRAGVVSVDGAAVWPLDGFNRVYDLALEALRTGSDLETLAQSRRSGPSVAYDELVEERRLLPPIDHPDPAHCLVTLTGLTHLGSAASRDEMHTPASAAQGKTDTSRMFQIGIAGGKPAKGEIGAQPEWGYKGSGNCIQPPGHAITQPAFAEDGGEEAEIAGIYMIDGHGNPWRVGFALGNEFSDHVMEGRNYLYLAHSKIRECSLGPELMLGPLPERISGAVRVLRDGRAIWSAPFESGEANMCHSIANLEHHHFKYREFRHPGDVHVHFFGANAVSFGVNLRTQAGDVFEVDVPAFGRPLRNPLKIEGNGSLVQVRAL